MPVESKLATFIASNKLDARRILATSHTLESLGPEDRKIKLAKRRGKATEGAPKETSKPKSGRPITNRAMAAALKGAVVSGPTKTRILRAINHLLELKKKEKVQLKSLF